MMVDRRLLAERSEYRVPELAIASGVSESTIRDLIRKGQIVATKSGRDWLIAHDDAIVWMTSYKPYGTLRGKRQTCESP